MSKYFEGYTADGVPMADWKALQDACKELDRFTIKIMSAEQAYTDRQRRWYKGICLKGLSDWNGESILAWDRRLKTEYGQEVFHNQYIKMDDGTNIFHLDTISNKSKKQMNLFIGNILDAALEHDWPVTAPDPDKSTF